jgi:putative phosphoesterase
MKLGVISDIHGDYQALETVLDRLDNHHQVNAIVCAGDLVGRGPQPNRVVEVIREREIPTVLGNHDEWQYNLSDESVDYLQTLPIDLRLNYDGCELFMCHGKPGSNMWGLYRDHVSETLLKMMLSSLKVDALITGHTHIPMFIRVDEGVVVNPGSIFTFKSARETSHSYGVLHLPQMTFDLFDVNAEPVQRIPIPAL